MDNKEYYQNLKKKKTEQDNKKVQHPASTSIKRNDPISKDDVLNIKITLANIDNIEQFINSF